MFVENYICLKLSDENVVFVVPGIIRNLFTMLEECPNRLFLIAKVTLSISSS